MTSYFVQGYYKLRRPLCIAVLHQEYKVPCTRYHLVTLKQLLSYNDKRCRIRCYQFDFDTTEKLLDLRELKKNPQIHWTGFFFNFLGDLESFS